MRVVLRYVYDAIDYVIKFEQNDDKLKNDGKLRELYKTLYLYQLKTSIRDLVFLQVVHIPVQGLYRRKTSFGL